MTSRLIASYVKPSADAATMDARRKAGLLSEREREVASLVGAGKTYGEISREAEDDFHALFGRESLRAYEEQVERLQAERDPEQKA